MITIKGIYFSDVQPPVNSGLWLQPINGGFTAHLIINGSVLHYTEPKELKSEEKSSEDILKMLIGSAKDGANVPSIFGVKAYVDKKIKSLE